LQCRRGAALRTNRADDGPRRRLGERHGTSLPVVVRIGISRLFDEGIGRRGRSYGQHIGTRENTQRQQCNDGNGVRWRLRATRCKRGASRLADRCDRNSSLGLDASRKSGKATRGLSTAGVSFFWIKIPIGTQRPPSREVPVAGEAGYCFSSSNLVSSLICSCCIATNSAHCCSRSVSIF
jgi:hypothetical protein